MNRVIFRFYEELNDYLPEEMRKGWIESSAEPGTSVGEKIASYGIPLGDIDLILVNQQSESFNYILQNEDRISVYPVFESFDISRVSKLRDKPLRELAFICDVHLGRLCKYLRMLGFDTLYSNDYTPQKIIEISNAEKRIILSKNIQLIRHKEVTHAYWVRSANPREQLNDLIYGLDILKWAQPLTRCLNCNSMLERVKKEDIINRLEERTATYYTEFFRCPGCDQIYWKGSHYESMLEFIHQIEKP
ncbi:MAG: Mut7-C RNAse domain-containing protein [Candidatus Saccharibacteria bacterium]